MKQWNRKLLCYGQKGRLKANDFKYVYLRSSKSHTERILELNTKTLLSELPNGNEFHVTVKGRIVMALSHRERRVERCDNAINLRKN